MGAKWTHGTKATRVTLEFIPHATMRGVMVTYNAGKQPEALYAMPGGSKRKGLWRHPWKTPPDIAHDAERGLVIHKLRGKSAITNFYHR